MCGIGGFSKPYVPKPDQNWNDLISTIFDDKKSDSCIFIELMKGCNKKECLFNCDARKEPEHINISPEAAFFAIEFFRINKLVLYGCGNSSNYPYNKIRSKFTSNGWFYNCQINLDSSCPKSMLEFLIKERAIIVFNVFNEQDAKFINQFQYKNITKRIQAMKNNDFFSIYDILRNGVLFHSTTEKSPDFISVENFLALYKQRYGFTLNSNTITNVSMPPKPVIEDVKINDNSIVFCFRRCFLNESNKFNLCLEYDKEKIKIYNREQHNGISVPTKEQTKDFYNFLMSPSVCKLCKGQSTWKAWEKEAW